MTHSTRVVFWIMPLLFISPITALEIHSPILNMSLQQAQTQNLAPVIEPINDNLEPGGVFLPWVPQGDNDSYVSAHCAPWSLFDRLVGSYDVAVQAQRLGQYLEDCESEITRKHLVTPMPTLVKYSQMDYQMQNNPHVSKVRLTLSNGQVVNGLLALKPDHRPRPMIIAKCGVFCNAENSVTNREFVMRLYDESPFHVLTLGNLTGTDFQIDNGVPAIGGFDEGRQIMAVVELLRSRASHIKNRVSSFHILGISLGGHAALYSSLYASANPTYHQPAVQSVLSMCPVVSLENSLQGLYKPWVKGSIAGVVTLQIFREVIHHIPILRDIVRDVSQRLSRDEVYEAVVASATRYYGEVTEQQPWDKAPFIGEQIRSTEDFWRVNDFVSHADRVQVPTLVIPTKNDLIVNYQVNSKLLELSDQLAENPNLHVVPFRRGDHCGFSVANGWGTMSALIRGYFLAHSPEFRATQSTQKADLGRVMDRQPWWRRVRLGPSSRYIGHHFHVKKNDREIRLDYKLFQPRRGRHREEFCHERDAMAGHPRCVKTRRIKLRYSDLPIPGARPPRSSYEAEGLTRFLNTRLRLTNEDGELTLWTSKLPTVIEFED